MRTLHQAEEASLRAEPAETPPRQTAFPHSCESAIPCDALAGRLPSDSRSELGTQNGDRHFLTALLRALSIWSA